ncbi:MAG: YggT family protein [Elainellaceae cyanobacterium]
MMTEYPNRDRPDPQSSGEYPPPSEAYPPSHGEPSSYPDSHGAAPGAAYPAEYGEDYHQRRQALQLEAEERRLREEQRRMDIERRNLIVERITSGVYYLVGALEVLLLLRFILRLTGANVENTFARVIYGLSEPFAAPFSTLFISPTFAGDRNIFDVNLLVAIVVYALLGVLVGRLIQVIGGTRS